MRGRTLFWHFEGVKSPIRPDRFAGLLVLFSSLAHSACTTSAPDEGVLFRSHTHPQVIESGIAVAPVAYNSPSEDSGKITRFLTQQMTSALYVGWTGGPFVPPAELLTQVNSAGPQGRQTLEEFHRGRMRAEPLRDEDCTTISRLILHRYLLLSWAEERLEEGLVESDRDVVEYGFANDVRRLRWERVYGKIRGVVLDLWEAQTVWEGVAPYSTDVLYGGQDANEQQLAMARDDGILDFLRLLSAP